MQIRAEQKNSRQSARKVRLIANQVRKMPLDKAFEQLALMERKASIVLLKVMRQAVANAVHNHQLTFEDLELHNIIVKVGPTYKRWQPVSRGRAHKILKRTCHVEVILKTKEAQGQKKDAQSVAKKTDDESSKKAEESAKNSTNKKVSSAKTAAGKRAVKKSTKKAVEKKETKEKKSLASNKKQTEKKKSTKKSQGKTAKSSSKATTPKKKKKSAKTNK